MASASCLLSEEQLLCSICLDVFNHPVTLPCGHNYCKACLAQLWEGRDQYSCPMCKEVFKTRPELRVNTLLSDMAAELRKSLRVEDSSRPDQQHAEPEDVPCDFCAENKNKAVKTCLECVMSYCDTHLEPHLRVPRLKKHQLIDPVENIEDRMCQKHNKPLEMFCQTEQLCVCQICCLTDHKLHQAVPLKEEYEGKKAQLGQTEAEVQQKIQQRRLKIQKIQHSVKLSKDDADREIADGVKISTALIRSIEKIQAELISSIQDKHKSTERRAEGFIKELEQEIMELTKRSSELEKLSHTEDHLHLLQNLPSLITPPHTKDWTTVIVHQPSYVGTVSRALDQLEEPLNVEIKKIREYKLKKIQQDAVDVTLDPKTARNYLVLSEDGKQVYCRKVNNHLDSFQIMFQSPTVLAKQSFSSGRFYYEVEVKGKTDWLLGVVKRSINRKGGNTWSPSNGCWVIGLHNGEHTAYTDPDVHLSVREKLQKVGVLVDYEEGLVSFYDVENKVLIYSFTACCFTEPLYPVFGPGKYYDTNSSPLIITPVYKSD